MLVKIIKSRIRFYRFLGACGNMLGLSIILALALYVAVHTRDTNIKLEKKECEIKQLEKENNKLRKLNKIGARICLPASTIEPNWIKNFYQ